MTLSPGLPGNITINFDRNLENSIAISIRYQTPLSPL